MVYRLYVERKPGFDNEAKTLKNELTNILGIKNLEKIRYFNRYDVEGLSEELFKKSVTTVFSEPQTDNVSYELENGDAKVFAVEYLPGQFDQRADSAAQCIQIISQQERPTVRSAKVYMIYGDVSDEDMAVIKKHEINPVESREAQLGTFETLALAYDIPENVAVLEGFLKLDEKELGDFIAKYGLAMDLGDIKFCQQYFKDEGRDPTITEIRVLDTYWSDHCRHTTFNTIIDDVRFDDPLIQKSYEDYLEKRREIGRTKPVCLMDLGTFGGRYLGNKGLLPKLDVSDEINACTVKVKVKVDGEDQDWLLLFKNETHNHPTEIEPFGGAATCIGGAIRDPLSGRGYVYAAMRVTGAADPTVPVSETMPGKLPQRTIVTKATAGYSSYGNQIGLATGIVDEVYHPGYAAKRMEIGAVIAAVPEENVRREEPSAGDVVILLGGRTGRDGMGGATGSSKSHNVESIETCGAEVQKGNAPEERKLQRLFRNREASLLIKRCNDFGAGGVSVAIGEIAEGLEIDLNAVPKKYEGLDGTELAISESQERMAVAVEAKDAKRFMEIAESENLEANIVARVTDTGRLVMNWNGKAIVNIARSFLDTNGAEKHVDVHVAKAENFDKKTPESFKKGITELAEELNVCSKRGLSERFDSTIGAGTVLMPFGGKYQLTPVQSMVHKISVEKGHTDMCSFMSWGYNPMISEKSPYHGAYFAVIESVAKLAATGASLDDTYMSFQEYFERVAYDPDKWGNPMASLLGALRAQLQLGIAAIGGKDSMSGSFEDIHVPPTLTSFAVTTDTVDKVVSPEFKKAGHRVAWIKTKTGADGLPIAEDFKKVCAGLKDLKPYAMYTPTYGGAAEAVMKMCFGNGLGFKFDENITLSDVFAYNYGSFIVETDSNEGITLGYTTDNGAISFKGEKVELSKLFDVYEAKLESVYPAYTDRKCETYKAPSFKAASWAKPKTSFAKPLALIPVFPGTNCEFDSAKAMRDAGTEAEIIVINNLTAASISESVENFARRVEDAQMIFIPGGFSGGDEPDGSGKFITAFFRNPAIKESVNRLLNQRDGLMCGICNGFQALVKLGLVPYGEIRDMDYTCPTLTFNNIGRHQSRLVRTRIASNKSPWLMETNPGEIYTVPISHGEGKFFASEELIEKLIANGQIATQYVDLNGVPTSDILCNPNGSTLAIEGITSPDGRVIGKMGHTERYAEGLYKNVDGNFDPGLFRSAVKYFK